MITKTDLKEQKFGAIERYFDAVLEAQTKGDPIELMIKAMSQRQRNHFAEYLDSTECKYHHSHIDEAKKVLFTQN